MRESKSTSSMRFTRVQLNNWRNFTDIRVALSRRIFLVGPNASGKSNLLDAFRFLRDIVSIGGGFQEAVRKRGGVSSLRCLAARRYSDLILKVSVGNQDGPSQWEYELAFSQDNLRRPIIKSEVVTRSNQAIRSRPDEDDKKDPDRLKQTLLEQLHANQQFRELADFFASIRYLHVVPQLIREPDRSIGRSNDPFGGDFLEGIARTSEKTRGARLRRIRKALELAVPQLKGLELWRDVRGTPHLRGKYEHWRPQGAWQTEEHFSDGTLRLIGLLWALQEGSGPLLLEEPELSLHPEVVRFLPQMFARVQSRTDRQTLVSTHSTEMLQDEGIGLDEVLLLLPGEEGTEVKPASSYSEIKILLEQGYPLADAVMPRTKPENVHQLMLFGD